MTDDSIYIGLDVHKDFIWLLPAAAGPVRQ